MQSRTAAAFLKALFDQLKPGGYLGFLAYIERNDAHEAALSAMRECGAGRPAGRDRRRLRSALPPFDRTGL